MCSQESERATQTPHLHQIGVEDSMCFSGCTNHDLISKPQTQIQVPVRPTYFISTNSKPTEGEAAPTAGGACAHRKKCTAHGCSSVNAVWTGGNPRPNDTQRGCKHQERRDAEECRSQSQPVRRTTDRPPSWGQPWTGAFCTSR